MASMPAHIVEAERIPGVVLAKRDVNEDGRGSFLEIFREDSLGVSFVQANHSRSTSGVLRGLHYHARQSDAWYVVSGTARVGLADLRVVTDRPVVATIDLSPDEPAVLYIPPGVAHGFAALTDLDLVYWVTHYYDAADEHGVAWNDPVLAVPWRVEDPILSERDAAAPPLEWGAVAAALA